MKREIKRSHGKVLKRSAQIANARMREEILPRLQNVTNPNLRRSWNPFTTDFAGPSMLAFKLRMPDMLVMQILRDPELSEQARQIAIESTTDGMMVEAKTFIGTMLNDLISEDSFYVDLT